MGQAHQEDVHYGVVWGPKGGRMGSAECRIKAGNVADFESALPGVVNLVMPAALPGDESVRLDNARNIDIVCTLGS